MELSPEQVKSVNILLNAVQVAQRRGAYSLQDAHTLQEAIDALVPREEQERQREEALEAQAEGADGDVSPELPADEAVDADGDDSEEPAADVE